MLAQNTRLSWVLDGGWGEGKVGGIYIQSTLIIHSIHIYEFYIHEFAYSLRFVTPKSVLAALCGHLWMCTERQKIWVTPLAHSQVRRDKARSGFLVSAHVL